MTLIKNVVFVGDTTPGTTSEQRARALSTLGFRVATVSIRSFPSPQRLLHSAQLRLYLAGLPIGYTAPKGFNEAIVKTADRFNAEMLWIEKGTYVWRRTIERVLEHHPNCTVVGFSPDDMSAKHNRSKDFDRHFELYHAFLSTKSYNVSELSRAGGPKVMFVPNGYDPQTHRPMSNEGDRGIVRTSVGFIGTFESARARSLAYLAAKGISVRIWGSFWHRWGNPPTGVIVEGHDVVGDDYARAISTTDINLCFLRKLNRDLQTTRSIEIPACGGFMLAERTDEHRELFEEGIEAEFFDSNEELVDKCRYYLRFPEIRKRIAEAGRERCVRSGYDYASRLAAALREIDVTAKGLDNHLRRSGR
jgi:spore maturation protein CgeB